MSKDQHVVIQDYKYTRFTFNHIFKDKINKGKKTLIRFVSNIDNLEDILLYQNLYQMTDYYYIHIHNNNYDSMLEIDKYHQIKKVIIETSHSEIDFTKLSKYINNVKIIGNFYNQNINKIPENINYLSIESISFDANINNIPKNLKLLEINSSVVYQKKN